MGLKVCAGLAAVVVGMGAVLIGQTSAPATRPSEVEALRAENARLRAEVVALQAKIAATGTATQVAKKDLARPFTTMMEVLEGVPAELRPQGKPEWYKFTEGKFVKWVEEKMVGMTVDVSMQYWGGQTMALGGNFTRMGGAFGEKSFTYFGAVHEWTVCYPTIRVDEAGARKWDAVKKGTLFRVKGVIKSVSIMPSKYFNQNTRLPEYRFTFELADLEMNPP